ncbi:uncharacterized protein LOC110465035 [Mizuhopecten yessoensis]|uniref:Uncharacterized protein n=1 Tax=Mizuhopecten yessoensis TaxID=6573 RepID=A0A210PSI1_MIZYE|nr:uncharacterized protein LOC110465035 [Mizuhopecten yessoensis]OWF39453.1 hypothetical protein KP79_PYT19853 [Mizuhopecten yessoensis]
MAEVERRRFGNLVTKVKDVQSNALYYRRLSWFLFGAEMPMLTGGCFLDDGRLLLSDYNNKKLILFDDSYNYIKHISVDGWPYDVTRGRGEGEIYIVLCKSVILRCHLNDDELIIRDRIRVPDDVRCVSVLDDVIFTGSRSAVSMMTLDGVILEALPKAGGNTYLASSSLHRKFFHKDGDIILCRTLDGNEVFRYEDSHLIDPRGMCLDHDDNLYVCGYKSKNLIKITHDGQRGRVVLNRLHKILRPMAIVYHPTKQQFIVTSYGEDTAFEVYQVSCW